MATIFRAPLIQRSARRRKQAGEFTVASNLLLTVLAVAAVPFHQTDWPKPVARARAPVVSVAPNLLLTTLAPASVAAPFVPRDWPNPKTHARRVPVVDVASNLLRTTLAGALSDEEYLAWLRDPNKSRVVLIEAVAYVSGAEVTHYGSNKGYVSCPTDTPANIPYDDWLVAIPDFSTSMSEQFTGKSTPSWGDAEIANENGVRDSWLTYGWDGRSLILRLGDPSWPLSDFRAILTGNTADIYAKDQSTLALRIRDKQWQLNVPVQTNLIGGTTANKDLPKPLCYGPCRNIEPFFIGYDAEGRPEYLCHDGGISGVATVYDSAISVPFIANNAAGTFVLLAQPYGLITADVNGELSGAKGWGQFIYGVDLWGNTYFYTCADLMSHLITTHTTLTTADFDEASFTAFKTLCPQPLGLYVRDRQNLIEVLDSLIRSVGGWYGFSADGLLQLGRLEDPSGATSVLDLVPDDLLEGDLRSIKHQLPQSVVRLGYRKNWTVMRDAVTGVGGVAGAVTEERRAELAEEYLVAKAEDASVKTMHLLAAEPELEGTLLVNEADAIAEAERSLDLHGVARQVFQANAFTTPYGINLGVVLNITNPRYGFSAGAKAQIVKIVQQPTKNQLLLDLWK